MANNDNFKKMYHDGAQVGIVALAESGTQTPANIESWTLDDYGKPTSIAIKDGVTSIPAYFQSKNDSLTAVTLPNSITRIDGSAFQDCKGGFSINIPSGITKADDYIFQNSVINSDLTFPASTFTSGSSGSGSTANWGYAFTSADICGHTITIENGVEIIPRNFLRGTQNYKVIIPSSVTYLSQSCFASLYTSSGTTRIVEFLGNTPPNEGSNSLGSTSSAWYTSNTSYLEGLRIIVPNSYSALTAYKNKFPEVTNYIERKS